MNKDIDVLIKNNSINVKLLGRIDSLNGPYIEEELLKLKDENPAFLIVLDAEKLNYISSYGLRIFMRIMKIQKKLEIFNVSDEVYDVMEMTGFSNIMEIHKI